MYDVTEIEETLLCHEGKWWRHQYATSIWTHRPLTYLYSNIIYIICQAKMLFYAFSQKKQKLRKNTKKQNIRAYFLMPILYTFITLLSSPLPT